MRRLVQAALLVASAAGFCFVLSSAASADVVEPSSAYQPASTGLLTEGKSPPAGVPGARPEGTKTVGETSKPAAEPRSAPVATPAPEPQVRQVPAHLARRVDDSSGSALAQAVRPLRLGVERIGSFLGRVVSSCQVAAGSGAGGPALVLAVLSVAAALDRRRVFAIRPTTDEDAPELLLSSEVIKPG